MFGPPLNYVAAVLFALSAIVFIEVLINFKRPRLLKAILLAITIGFAWRGLGILYGFHYGYNRWGVDMPNSVIAALAIIFFAYLYENKLKWYIIAFACFVVAVQLAYFLYYTYVIPVPASVALTDLNETGSFNKVLRSAIGLLIGLISLRILLRIRLKYKPRNIYLIQLRKWSMYVLIFQLLSVVTFVLKNFKPIYNAAYFINLLLNCCAVLFFLLRPRFLNKANLKISFGDFFNKEKASELPQSRFIDVFFTKCYYLNQEASVEDLSKKLSVSTDSLNNFLFANYGLGFTDLINKHRVEYFMDIVRSGKFRHYTIDALAQESGFNSRHHLYKPFKKFHGGTPSDFVRSVTE